MILDLVLPPRPRLWLPRRPFWLWTPGDPRGRILWSPPDPAPGRYILERPCVELSTGPVWCHIEMSGRWVNEMLRNCGAKELKRDRVAGRSP